MPASGSPSSRKARTSLRLFLPTIDSKPEYDRKKESEYDRTQKQSPSMTEKKSPSMTGVDSGSVAGMTERKGEGRERNQNQIRIH